MIHGHLGRDCRLDAKTGGLIGVYLGLGLIGWLTVSRIVRANTMSLKEREFSEAARSIGASKGRIMFRHMLPNTIAPIVVATTLGIPAAILAEAGISFLGYRGDPANAKLGADDQRCDSANAGPLLHA